MIRRIALRQKLAVIFGLLLLSGSSSAFLNRGYSTLEKAEVMQGDFNRILASGKLRILVQEDYSSVLYLPRKKSPLSEQQAIVEAFADSHGLKSELVLVDNFSQLIPALEEGKGDIVIGNLTINDQRRKKIAFSVPVDHVKEQVLVASDNDSIKEVKDLNGKTVMVNEGSTFWHALVWLKENSYPDIDIKIIPDGVTRERLLDQLVDGEFDATIMDSNLVEIYHGYREDFKVATNFSSQRNIGWGIRKDAPKLVSEINRYLQLEHTASKDNEEFIGDLNLIEKRNTLRVLMRNNAASYFLYKGQLMGFEYELAREFADYHNLRLEIVVPPGNDEMVEWLRDGKADIALGFLEPNDAHREAGIAFSKPYHYAPRHMVVHRESKVKQVGDLAGKEIVVRQNSAESRTVGDLLTVTNTYRLKAIDDAFEIEQLIAKIGGKEFSATVADQHILDIAIASGQPVKSAFALDQEIPHAIALRKGNPELKVALDKFVDRMYKSEFYNVLYRRYFESKRSIAKLAKGRAADTLTDGISPFDPLVQKYADRYGFDWRLITAQMYEESEFNPNARSPAGAVGLMQLMPRTAKSLGVKNMKNPANSIDGGVQYLSWLRDRFDDDLPLSERLWFSLAAYNAGVGHVHDARRLAKQLGLDEDKWFDNTEHAMLLLSEKKYAKKARYGYVNGKEPVDYVRDIKERFEAYIDMSGNLLTRLVLEPAA